MTLLVEDLPPPKLDPALIFELYRGNYATELLCAAVGPLNVFGTLASGPLTLAELGHKIGLERRAAIVLTTALRAMGLLGGNAEETFCLSPMAEEHLLPTSPYDVSGYVAMNCDSPGVRTMLKRLRSNRPAGQDEAEPGGVAFIYREGIESAMDEEASARRLTMALAGRARNVAPVLALRMPLPDTRLLLDVGGGTGIYSFAYLQAQPDLRAIVFDRAEVLKVAAHLAGEYGVTDRVELHAGDMFKDPLPASCDAVLLSNVLHDWDEPQCELLIRRCASALRPGGRLLIHDVFLHDALDGPLPIALYSAALFSVTEGRAYSAAEYRSWVQRAGLTAGEIVATLAHCGVLVAVAPS